MGKVLFIDTLDFENFPSGGCLNFARQLLDVFGNRLCLVGIDTDNSTPLGQWVDKEINGTTYKFFAFGHRKVTAQKPFIPPRITGYFQLLHYRKAILSLGVKNVFIQNHEVMMAVYSWEWEYICFRFPGVENPLSISRYYGVGLFSKVFDRLFFNSVNHADVILAAADVESINAMIKRSEGKLTLDRIVQFPTRVDTSIFHPIPKDKTKKFINFPENAVVVVTSGRIHWAKGWKFLIDAFLFFSQFVPNSYLCFIGDGEDRDNLIKYAKDNGCYDRIRVTGFQTPPLVAIYLNSAKLYVSGSYIEGWSTAMIEALSCGIPIVSTKVSSAHEIVAEGYNGYVVEERNVEKFAEAMRKALSLENVKEFSINESHKYALKYLATDFEKVFPPLSA